MQDKNPNGKTGQMNSLYRHKATQHITDAEKRSRRVMSAKQQRIRAFANNKKIHKSKQKLPLEDSGIQLRYCSNKLKLKLKKQHKTITKDITLTDSWRWTGNKMKGGN